MTITHYGKDIEQHSKEEQTLMKLDQTMILLFREKHYNEDKDKLPMFLIEGIINEIGNKRTHIILGLLNLSVDDFDTKDDVLEYIETTKYGFDKFLKDWKKNCERLEREEQLSKLN